MGVYKNQKKKKVKTKSDKVKEIVKQELLNISRLNNVLNLIH